MGLGERGQRRLGPGVEHPAARHDRRAPSRAQGIRRRLQLARVGARSTDMPRAGPEERLGPVEGLGLHVLAEGQRHRPAGGGVTHRRHRARQGRQQLLGSRDAVEVARDRAQRVVRRDGAVAPVLDLLEHRVRRAVREDVAGDQQQRQAVDMRRRRRRHEVRGPRPDRGRHRHGAAAAHLLGVGDRGMGHRLLVLAAPGGQRVADPVQGLPQARDVAMPEDGPDAGQEGLAVRVRLVGQPAHHGLRGGEADRAHAACSLVLRAPSQARQRVS